jgi:hypothetical protein
MEDFEIKMGDKVKISDRELFIAKELEDEEHEYKDLELFVVAIDLKAPNYYLGNIRIANANNPNPRSKDNLDGWTMSRWVFPNEITKVN